MLRRGIAETLRMDPEIIRIVSRYIGRAFGVKGIDDARSPSVAVAAKRLNRPVKLIITRAQGLTTATARSKRVTGFDLEAIVTAS